jgi:O-antigen/teichoic acid export membrane protein
MLWISKARLLWPRAASNGLPFLRAFLRQFTDLTTIRNWLWKGGWAILDQGLFAGANFLLGVVLARWLPAQEFGVYTVAYSGFLLLGTLHTPLLTEPMLVFGATEYRHIFPSYLRMLTGMHWKGVGLVCIGLSLATGSVALLSQRSLYPALAAAFAAAPFILFSWLVRRSCYVEGRPEIAACGGMICFIAMSAGFFALALLHRLSAASAFAVIAAGSAVSGVAIQRLMPPHVPSAHPQARAVLRQHWSYGRWALLASGLSWAPANWYYVVLPVWGGFEATAALRALMILIMPILQANNALGLLVLPLLANHRENRPKFRRLVLSSSCLFAGLACAYWLLLLAAGPKLMVWLYGDKYGAYLYYLPWLGALPVLAAVTGVLCGALRARGDTRSLSIVYALVALLTVSGGTALVASFGPLGGVLGLTISSVLTAAGSLLAIRRGYHAADCAVAMPEKSVTPRPAGAQAAAPPYQPGVARSGHGPVKVGI